MAIDWKKLQNDKFNSEHKAYKTYLNKAEDAEIIKAIDNSRNRAAFLREALKFYVEALKGGAV